MGSIRKSCVCGTRSSSFKNECTTPRRELSLQAQFRTMGFSTLILGAVQALVRSVSLRVLAKAVNTPRCNGMCVTRHSA